ncbi:MAG: hypothetical protein J5594_03395 [Elusimicrobiaceae bacterium]|nr:hypothetical protein [Elusimicrobiaceae bacterium]
MKIKRKDGSVLEICKSKVYDLTKLGLTDDFLKNLPDNFDNIGTTIYAARNQIKVLDSNGHKINIKKYCIPPIINRFFYSTGLRTPKCISAFINAQKILDVGFETPKPYAYIIERKNGLIRHSYFISDQIENAKQVRECHGVSFMQAYALYTAQIHEKGLFPRDYTPGNILCRKEDGKYRFFLIDVNRFYFKNKPLTKDQAPYNLYTTMSSERALCYFIRCYSKYRGMDEKYLKYKTFLCRRVRAKYSALKKLLKKIPGVKKLTLKPIKKNNQ